MRTAHFHGFVTTKIRAVKYVFIILHKLHVLFIPEPKVKKQSEVSQKEKHQYSILTHIYGI